MFPVFEKHIAQITDALVTLDDKPISVDVAHVVHRLMAKAMVLLILGEVRSVLVVKGRSDIFTVII